MGDNIQSRSLPDLSDVNDSPKFFHGLSTILVATIQELKDRISQIEFIFCNQLFPNFQAELSKYKALEKRLSKVNKDAEENWKQKERSLLRLIEDLRKEKENALESNLKLRSEFECEKKNLFESFKIQQEELIETHKNEKANLLLKVKELDDSKEKLQKMDEQFALAHASEQNLRQHLHEKDEELTRTGSELLNEQQKRAATSLKFNQLKKRYLKLKHCYEMISRTPPFSSENDCGPNTTKRERDRTISPPLLDSEVKETEDNCCFHEIKNIESDMDSEEVKNDGSGSSPGVPSSDGLIFHDSDVPLKTAARVNNVRSKWRHTRTRQSPGADPHDDFLDTPIANVPKNINRCPSQDCDFRNKELASDDGIGVDEHIHDVIVHAPKDMDFDVSDEETQEITELAARNRKTTTTSNPNKREFKYVEPVRKKSERELLKGVECKECKKFYDAVLEDDRGDSNYRNRLRCEHEDGVSRHRYRYVPPSTPEGFWNIGFDTDM